MEDYLPRFLDPEENQALQYTCRLLRFQRFLRLMTELSLGLTAINGLLLVGVLVFGMHRWEQAMKIPGYGN